MLVQHMSLMIAFYTPVNFDVKILSMHGNNFETGFKKRGNSDGLCYLHSYHSKHESVNDSVYSGFLCGTQYHN